MGIVCGCDLYQLRRKRFRCGSYCYDSRPEKWYRPLHLQPRVGKLIIFASTVRLPKATYNEDTGQTTCSRKVKDPLQLGRLPAAYSVGIFNSSVQFQSRSFPSRLYLCNRETLLVDPTSFEEPLMDAQNTVILDEKHDLVSVSSTGFVGMSEQDHVRSSIQLAREQHALVADALYSS